MNHTRARARAFLLAAAAAAAPLFAQSDPDPATPPPAEPVIQLVPALLASGATPDARRASANELVSAKRLAPLRSALAGEGGDDAATAAADAISAAPSAELMNLLASVATDADDAHATVCARALEAAGGRDALRALVTLMNASAERPALRAQTAASLEKLTGVNCDPAEPAAWLEWWGQTEWLPEAEWQTALATTYRERWLAAADDRNVYAARTESLYRRLYSELPPEARTALLGEILALPGRSMRLLGLELIERSLLNGRPVDASLAGATAEALADHDPRARRLAARSLARFAPGVSRDAALAALRREKDNETAAAIMDLLAAGAPDETVAERCAPWLETSGAACDAAARLLVRTFASGRSPGDGFTDRVRASTVARVSDAPTPALVDLLAAVGSDNEVDLIASLLPDAPASLAGACVRALAKMPGGYARLANVAESHPDLRPALAELLSRHAADLAAYRFVLRLGGLEHEAQRAALARIWTGLPQNGLLPAARETSSPAMRAAMLRDRLLGDGLELAPETRRALVLLYAESLSLAGTPGEALEAIGMLDPSEQALYGAELASLALQRLHETGAPPPDPTTCSPGLWTAAFDRLTEASPQATLALARQAGMRAHIQTDLKAEEALLLVLERAETRTPPPEQASLSPPAADDEGPG